MNMTHYMELLAANQPWNLIIFMAIPIVLAETIAVTELYILYTREYKGAVRQLNRVCSIVVGLYFAGVFFYLLRNAVMPITAQSAWRGPADVIAVTFYLLGSCRCSASLWSTSTSSGVSAPCTARWRSMPAWSHCSWWSGISP
jgi:uncharacterized protein DUF6803